MSHPIRKDDAEDIIHGEPLARNTDLASKYGCMPLIELPARAPYPKLPSAIAQCVEILVEVCFGSSYQNGWWHHRKKGHSLLGRNADGEFIRNTGELIALQHSELSEALEGARKGTMDEHLPQFTSETVELADAIIRICDHAGARGLPLGDALAAKLLYNDARLDHKPENRAKAGGKAF